MIITLSGRVLPGRITRGPVIMESSHEGGGAAVDGNESRSNRVKPAPCAGAWAARGPAS